MLIVVKLIKKIRVLSHDARHTKTEISKCSKHVSNITYKKSMKVTILIAKKAVKN